MACGKKPYPDKVAAATARNFRLASRTGHNRPEHLRIYHCPECNAWHMAHGKAGNDKFLPRIRRPRYHRPAPSRLKPPPSDV